jgi:signal transduction histidine kinase
MCPITADAAMLRQLIWNLVRNAVQASSAGSEVLVTVRVEPTRAVDEVELCVEDSGVGLTKEAKERIFDAFFTTRAQGTGVGLAVVKRIADDHGFTIEVVSESGQGATFTVRLGPLVEAQLGTPAGRDERLRVFPDGTGR